MRSTLSAVAAGLVVAGASVASAQTIIFEDDFDSYTTTAEMGAVWTLGDGTLDTSLGNPGNSLFHPGTSPSFNAGNTNTVSFTAASPTATDALIYQADIFDDGTSNNERISAGLRAAAGENVLEMGHYNQILNAHYAYRTAIFAGGETAAEAWLAFENIVDDDGNAISNAPIEGWHRYTATITPTTVTFELDLNSDGFVNASAVIDATTTAAGFDIIRLGGPSNLSSAGGGANFDNVSLTLGVIPEPTSLALLGMGGLGLLRRRR